VYWQLHLKLSGSVILRQSLIAGILQLFNCLWQRPVSFITISVADEVWPQFSWVWVFAAVIPGMVSALVQPVMNRTQKFLSLTRATIIYTGKPVRAERYLAGKFLLLVPPCQRRLYCCPNSGCGTETAELFPVRQLS